MPFVRIRSRRSYQYRTHQLTFAAQRVAFTANGKNTNLKSISASGHSVPPESLKRFGSALSNQSKKLAGITQIAIGSKDMGDAGVIALCDGLDESDGGLVQSLDLGWKEM